MNWIKKGAKGKERNKEGMKEKKKKGKLKI